MSILYISSAYTPLLSLHSPPSILHPYSLFFVFKLLHLLFPLLPLLFTPYATALSIITASSLFPTLYLTFRLGSFILVHGTVIHSISTVKTRSFPGLLDLLHLTIPQVPSSSLHFPSVEVISNFFLDTCNIPWLTSLSTSTSKSSPCLPNCWQDLLWYEPQRPHILKTREWLIHCSSV